MERLTRWLDKGLKQMASPEVIAAGAVFAGWAEIVGPAIARVTHPAGMRGGVLFVEVASAAWAQELTLLKPRVMSALKARGVELKDLRWQVVPRHVGHGGSGAELEPEPTLERVALDPLAREAIARQVAALADPDLAARLAAMLEAATRRGTAQKAAGYRSCMDCGSPLPPRMETRCPLCRARHQGGK